jgi:hypothetical protein
VPRQIRYRRFKPGVQGDKVRRRKNLCKQLWNSPAAGDAA